MNPLAAVDEYRTQATRPARTITIAPPPPVPVAATATSQPETVDDADPSGELELAAPGTEPPADTAVDSDDAAEDLPGMLRGCKRLINAYLPAATRQRLEAARAAHGTLGEAVMAALRGSYQWLVDTHTPAPAEAVGPFPAPTPPRRRLTVEEGQLRAFYVHPAEARAIDQLADQLELSLSQLVTLAIDQHYGEGGSLPAGPSPARPRKR
jgi:hypothetical protein